MYDKITQICNLLTYLLPLRGKDHEKL